MKRLVRALAGRMGYDLVARPRRDKSSGPGRSPLSLRDVDVRHCQVLPNRECILQYLPQGGMVAEVVVALGHFSESLLRVLRPHEFVAIDRFELHRERQLWGVPTKDIFHGATHEDYYRAKFKSPIEHGIVRISKGVSWDVLAKCQDEAFDVIYIDAGHDYESVKNDAMAACNKIKPNGFLVFNDYIRYDHLANMPYGVVHVVNELCCKSNYEMLYLAMHPEMFCDVALRQKPINATRL